VDQRRKALQHLLSKCPREPLTRETLNALLPGPDFALGLIAAEALGMKSIGYFRYALTKLEPLAASGAARWFLEQSIPGAIEYFVRRYDKLADGQIKAAVVYGLAGKTTALVLCVLRKALRDDETEVRDAAVCALSLSGGVDDVGPLYRLAHDRSQTEEVRTLAEESLTAIRKRIGDQHLGHLSIAGDGTGEGGLSLAEDAPRLPPDVDTFSGRS
jgi:hypothetical protein